MTPSVSIWLMSAKIFSTGGKLRRALREESADGRLRIPRVGDFEEVPAAPLGGVVHGGHPELFRGIDFRGLVAVFRAGDFEDELERIGRAVAVVELDDEVGD